MKISHVLVYYCLRFFFGPFMLMRTLCFFFAGWLVVSLFTLTIGMSLAEICSAYPTTGGLYFWTIKILEGRVVNGVQLGSPKWVPLASWVVGYTNWLGLCVAIASTDLAMAQFMASLISMTKDYTCSTTQIYGIYVGILFFHGVVNSMAVRLNGAFNIMSGNFFLFILWAYHDNRRVPV